MKYQALGKDEVARVVEGRGAASRVPVLLHLWVHPAEFGDRQSAVENILRQYPEDGQFIYLRMPDVSIAPQDDPRYRWINLDVRADQSGAIDARAALRDWSQWDEVLEKFPSPHYRGLVDANPPAADGRYRLAHWWFCLFERHWSLRGMTDALMDYYTNPREVHRLFRALTDFYLVAIERAKREVGADAIMTSDDLGTQTGPFFSPEVFREFYKPYYRELIDRTHELGMHFWLHACGCIEKFLPELVDLGLDVIHPIQKYTMDEASIARQFGDKITIWAGFDVQRVIPWGSPDDVRREVRFMMDTYCRPEGRFMLTAGNGINGDCPVESLRALYEEAFQYGSTIVRRRGRNA